MRYRNKLALLLMTAVLAITCAVSAAIGYSAGVARGSNMRETYPPFHTLAKRPAAPSPQDKIGIGHYERAGREYVEAAERYLNNVLDDIERISAEADAANAEADNFIAEYNLVMQDIY